MIAVFATATALTIIFTRSRLMRETAHLLILRYIPQRFVSDVDEFLTCPLCAGFWITLIVGLCIQVPFVEMELAYIGLVLTTALYDLLQRAYAAPDEAPPAAEHESAFADRWSGRATLARMHREIGA